MKIVLNLSSFNFTFMYNNMLHSITYTRTHAHAHTLTLAHIQTNTYPSIFKYMNTLTSFTRAHLRTRLRIHHLHMFSYTDVITRLAM